MARTGETTVTKVDSRHSPVGAMGQKYLAAGKRMGMSYKRAWSLVQALNEGWGSPLIETLRGGAQQGGAMLTADGELVFGNAHAGDFDFEADGSVVGGDIVATGRVSGEPDGAVELGNISAGATDSEDGDFSVGIGAEDKMQSPEMNKPLIAAVEQLGDRGTA